MKPEERKVWTKHKAGRDRMRSLTGVATEKEKTK